MSTLTVSRHFVEASLSGAERLGLDGRALLQEAGISPDLLRIEMARVSSDQFSKLMQVIWQRTGDEFMGMGPRRARSGTFATMCALVVGCQELGDVEQRASRCSRRFERSVCMGLEVVGGCARLVTRIEGSIHDPDYFVGESTLVIWHRLGSWVSGQPVEVEKAEF